MSDVRIIELKQSIFENNDKRAELLRQELKEKGTYLLNVMSSPGSGKTTTLVNTINRIKDQLKIAVMQADIDSDKDARTVASETGVEAIQLHTGGMCHLDADMTRQGVESLEGDFDLVILENVGNLVCPAEFDTGAVKSITILSVPEGDDKPLKYPLMYQVSSLALINKIDVLPYFDFDMDKAKEYIARRNPDAKVLPVSGRTGEGIDEFAQWLLDEVKAWKE
ncbi:MAG: hydrogenase nickel incorporation protein HypB [Phoenicibacter congonensis]|uniref:Hydrogenase nickel incorporation protein HypB n=1 Tax=Phoenicibacter congonensis TaxID=1944646 RepID=A0AA43RJV8_9ACTN|nr:hydrogenase nickel incorporation protein HypB [Phoenicibacter congonensis]